MESNRMGCAYCRPYNRTCGMNRPQPVDREINVQEYLEPAMAYVPYQKFTENFPLQYALSVGTVFPQLCKPFCGKRGMCR